MKQLSFAIDSSIDVPVEVYDSTLRLVDRTLSSCTVDVDPGRYLVIGRMPDGIDRRASIEVADGEPETVSLWRAVPGYERPRAADDDRDDGNRAHHGSPMRRSLGERRRQRRQRQRLRRLGQAAPPLQGGGTLTLYAQGTGGWHAMDSQPVWRVEHDLDLRDCDAVGLRGEDEVERFILIPHGRIEYFRLRTRPERDGTLSLVAGLANESADALLDYLTRGLLGDALVMSGSAKLSAETLLNRKRSDPLAAAAGAFALLQLGELERLHDWTSNLAKWFDWLPDALVAYAEHLGRIGEHGEARDLLKKLPLRGVPSLSIGVAYAASRLRLYAADDPHDRQLTAALNSLTAYAVAADITAKVTTFTGNGPNSPQAI